MDRDFLLVLISTPIYAIVIGAEFFYSHIKNKGLYSTKGLFSNIYLTALNMGLDLLVRVIVFNILTFFYQYKFFTLAATPILYWVALILCEDFLYYWLHRIDHYCRFFWAAHVTHHSSEEFNLTVGFRSSVFQPLYRFIYFIPIALLGFQPEDIMFVYAATQTWGILVHTQTVGKLWWPIEYIFCTPSHHRVHHASNIKYLDKNMGMLLIIWDRIFGTFEEEDLNYEKIKYGLTTNIRSVNPITLVFHEWISILKDIKKSKKLKDKLMYVFGPPGWSHDGSTLTSDQLRKLSKSN